MREICRGSDYRRQGVDFFYQNWVDVTLGFQKNSVSCLIQKQ